ncbi:hypothetical protein, partial [Corallococcus sicarius]
EQVRGIARELASAVRSGGLALFMGAGTGIAAGLPGWDELVEKIAAELGLDHSAEQWKDLGPLDAAEVLRRTTERIPGEPQKSLGDHVKKLVGDQPRYALLHLLLASLRVQEAITTNFDRLYEHAVADIEGRRPLVLVPEKDPSQVARVGEAQWLLKLHGDVEN